MPPISREHPAWSRLAEELLALARAVGAANAVVADSSENVWCRARELDTYNLVKLEYVFRDAMEAKTSPLDSGGTLSYSRTNAAPYAWACSFAGIYLLIIWFERPFNADLTCAEAKGRLSTIERLVLELPPDEPHPEAGAVSGPGFFLSRGGRD